MELESKALSSPRGDKENTVGIQNVSPNAKKRKRIEGDRDFKNSVVIHNVPPKTDRATLKDFVERMFLEMHGKRIKIAGCRCISNLPDRLTFLVTFKTSELVDLAISLNGVQLMNHTIYVNIYNPDWAKDKTWKSRLCFNSFCGGCKLGDKCRHAHDVLDLRLYHDTVLSKHRTIYISQFPFRFPHLLNTVKKKFMNHGMSPFFTAFHVRAHKQDALVEFADIRHAKKARDILNGTRIGKFEMEVHPWKPESHSGFVKYFENEARRTRSGGDQKHAPTLEPPAKRMRPDDTSRKDTRVPVDLTPEKQDQQAQALPPKTREKESQSAIDWEDDKRELRRLRDEVSKLRWQQEKLVHLEEENSDYKRLLAEAQDDVRYYRDKFERERSYVNDVRIMERKLDDLRRENDHLVREHQSSSGCYRDLQDELHDIRLQYNQSRDQVGKLKRENEELVRKHDYLIRENNDLHKRHHDSRSMGSYHRMDNSLLDELNSTKLKYENSRNEVYRLKWELDKKTEEKGNRVKLENDDLQRRLGEALTKNETMSGVLAATQRRLKDSESEKNSMNDAIKDLQTQNETLQEDIEQMRMNHAMELGFSGAGY